MKEVKDKIVLSEDELKARLLLAGFSENDPVSVKELQTNHCSLYARLNEFAKAELGGGGVIASLDHLQFKTKQVHDIKRELLRKIHEVITPDVVTGVLEGTIKGSDITEKIQSTKIYHQYEARRSYWNTKKKPMISIRKGSDSLPSFRELIKSEYPADFGFLQKLTGKVDRRDLTTEEVGSFLRERYYAGDDVSLQGLKNCSDGIYYRWLFARPHRRNEKRKKAKITNLIASLIGVEPSDISIREAKKSKNLGTISEHFARIVLWHAYSHDPAGHLQTESFRNSYPLPITDLYPKSGLIRGKDIHLHDADKNHHEPDILIESNDEICYVEVKAGRSITKQELRELDKHLKKPFIWNHKNVPVARKTLIAMVKDELYVDIMKHFSDSSISVISPQEMKKSFEITIDDLGKSRYLLNNVYSKEDVLKMYDSLINNAHFLIRQNQRSKLEFLDDTITSLLKRIQNGERTIPHRPIKIYGSEGYTVKNNAGTYLRFTVPVSQIPQSKCRDYVMKHADKIDDKEVFLDLETRGFMGKNQVEQIVLAGTGYKLGGELLFDVLFARNPWEEEAVVVDTVKLIEAKKLRTFNGKTFDYKLLEKRMNAHLLPTELPIDHVDLYRELRTLTKERQDKPQSLKLSSLPHTFMNVHLEDIKGKDSPGLYTKWLTTGDPTLMEKNIEHVVLDVMREEALRVSPKYFGNMWHEKT